ncbi:MAG: bifunctional 4-hydroxy-2-oxoglutarate aldolase/2-dehydro-3-deoxy-phosphogluconate aldolase [Planctomycetes bacterium]|nr:bifunctional 4-hydroxy-2-oxoglutarate aldolase/2-dehydro-3-deoxy-phosphogluconate aldolase [Planctomycetota bacterium]
MSTEIADRIAASRLVPVIALDKASDAAPLCNALAEGGLEVAEITFRTDAAAEAIAIVAKEFPSFALGAGTVTNLDQLNKAIDAGARFAVAPGCNPKIVQAAQAAHLPFYPGICNPSDIEAAVEVGCQTLKFFPAGAMGGVTTIKALYGPYKHLGIRFVPTGGIGLDNMAEYLACDGVMAIGGSWIVAPKLVNEGNWAEITRLTQEAVTIAQGVQ